MPRSVDGKVSMPRLSALILTRNEEEMLPHCLACLDWVDEILVVDSLSTDGTVAIARAAGARVLSHEFAGYASQYNWGLSQVQGDWILQIDADELVTPALRDAIIRLLDREPEADVYSFRRDSYVFGRRMRASSWSGEYVPRLSRRGKLRYEGEVHSDITFDPARAGRIPGVLIHYPYRSTERYFEKFQHYSSLWAEKAAERGRRSNIPAALASAMWRSFHNYFIRGEIWDGREGFVLSVLAGMHTFIRHMKLWGMQNARQFGQVHDVKDER